MMKQNRRSFFKSAVIGSVALTGSGSYAKVVPQKKKIPFELGLASYTLRKFDLDQAIAMIQRVNLSNVVFKSYHLLLDSTPEQIQNTLAKVNAAGLDLYGGGVIYMKNKADVDQAFEYAKAAGMRMIIGVPEHDVLEYVNEKVKTYDIQVAIHNHGPGDKKYPTPESVYEKIKNLDPRIGLCIDIGHTIRVGADPIEDVVRFKDRLLDVHIKDVSVASDEGKEIEIGRGVIDIPTFLKTLIEIQYPEIVSIEYENYPEDPLPGLAESVGYVRGVLAAL